MPIMRGTQLAARLRELKPELKVLLISGYADDLTDGLERRQADGLLQKPFTADALMARVRKVLDGSVSAQA
jgi:two-component system cell cycle sensor histidine kinase/response regulator CckA